MRPEGGCGFPQASSVARWRVNTVGHDREPSSGNSSGDSLRPPSINGEIATTRTSPAASLRGNRTFPASSDVPVARTSPSRCTSEPSASGILSAKHRAPSSTQRFIRSSTSTLAGSPAPQPARTTPAKVATTRRPSFACLLSTGPPTSASRAGTIWKIVPGRPVRPERRAARSSGSGRRAGAARGSRRPGSVAGLELAGCRYPVSREIRGARGVFDQPVAVSRMWHLRRQLQQ